MWAAPESWLKGTTTDNLILNAYVFVNKTALSLTLAKIDITRLLVIIIAPADLALEPWLRLGTASVPQLDPSSTFHKLSSSQAETRSGDGAPG